MIGKVNQAKLKPTLQGIMAQGSTYGSTIPRIYGTTMASPLITWMNGIRQSGSSKKGSKKGGAPTYRACVDMLLGHNPLQHVLRVISSNVGLGLRNNKLSNVTGPTVTITDPNFYCVVGVTLNVSYNFLVDDYGGQGPVVLSGNAELPCWNLAQQGPDPVNPSGYRWAPYVYDCTPGSNVVSQLYGFSGYNIYYAGFVLGGWGAGQIPIVYVLNSTFESSLGEGPAYTAFQDFSAQRIIYPWFAGINSSNFDIGMGAVPQIRTEVLGAYTLYPDPPVSTTLIGPSSIQPRADADYADMVEDVFKMGQTQAAMLSGGVGTATASSPIQAGVSCWDFPGTVQKKFWAPYIGSFGGTIQFDLPVTQGNILVVAVAQAAGGGAVSVSDSLGNAWSPVVNTFQAGFFYATANADGQCIVTIGGATGGADVQIFEIGGVDTVDAAPVFQHFGAASVPSGSVTTTSVPGQAAYVLAWVFPDLSGSVGTGNYPLWKAAVKAAGQGGNFYGAGPRNSYTQFRRTFAPKTYTFTGDAPTTTWTVVMLALKNAVAPSYPKALGDILEPTSLDLSRAQCRANGLWGSLNMNSQKKAADWLEDLYICMNSAPVWSGFKLKSVPRSETSFANNGAQYTAPTASGPVANLGSQDYIAAPGAPTVIVTRRAVVDRPDLLRIQHQDANNNYNNTVVSQPDVGGLTLYGVRYASPKVLDMIQHTETARMILGIQARRQNYLVRTYKFKLQSRWKLLEAMDLVLITDNDIGLNAVPVRLTSVQENEKFELECEAEDFIYGLHAPKPLPVTANQSGQPGSNPTNIPLPVNPPVFLEPPGALSKDANDELWIDVSDSDPTYGGSVVYVSVDGGVSYTQLGIINGSGVTGYTTADWPQALDPDNTNDLFVDLTESNGVLPTFSAQQRDSFKYPIFVDGGGGLFPFELGAYDTATLTAPDQYRIVASGGSTPPTPPPPGTEDMLNWIAMDSRRNTSHLYGTSSSGGASYGWCYLDPSGNKVWWIKTPNGNPWDIQLYDGTYFYHWITENADENAWSQAHAYKRINASHGYPTAQGVPVCPRTYTPGSPVTIDVAAPNPMVRTLLCETDGEPLIQLGDFRSVTAGPTNVAWGGDVGTQPTITVTVYRGNISTGHFGAREIFSYVKFVGWVQWRNDSLVSGVYPNGVYKTVQTTTRNLIIAGTASPNFPCGFKPGWP